MKIVFINASDIKGGAAVAAFRLSIGLKNYFNTDNYFLVGKKYSGYSNVFATRKKDLYFFIESIIDRILNKLGLQYFFFPFSKRFILKKIREIKPDIISIHNIHEGYFETSLLKKLSKIAPIAWTLHDMWGFTGNAAHTFGTEFWKDKKAGKNEKNIYPNIGINTGTYLLRRKARIYKKSNLTIITPSKWLFNLAKESPVFDGKRIELIHHGIDTKIFVKKDKKLCRQLLNISEDSKVLMFSSADDLKDSLWKGGRILFDILKEINSKIDYTIDLLIIGKGDLSELDALKNFNVHKIGFVNSELFLSTLLSSADIFIYPTKADNFPLTLLEAISCRTPCITFDIGGCSDIIKDDFNGFLIKPFDKKMFISKTMNLLLDNNLLNSLSSNAGSFTDNNFTLEKISRQYYELYSEIIKKNMS